MTREIIIVASITWILGMITGRFLRPEEEDCPRRVLGYNCMGKHWCDHRESVLYTAMATMARNAEERGDDKDRNLWGGEN